MEFDPAVIDYEITYEFSDLERNVEETGTLDFAAGDDLVYECERHAALLGARYGIMPRQRGRTRWEIREPGELLVVVTARKIDD